MPAFVTHNYLAMDVFKELDGNIQEDFKDALDYYIVFAQSFDNLFYYRLPLLVGKEVRKIGYKGQRINTQSYFINMIRLIMKNNLNKDSQALAYLYGSITHYVADTTFHPFVFYKTGVFKKNDKSTWKYNSLHTKAEYMFDAYLYKKRNNRPIYKWNFTKEMFPKLKPSNSLINLIDNTFKQTFHKNNVGNLYFKSYNWSRLLNSIAKKDRFGIKKTIYSTIDIISGPKFPKLKYFSTHINVIDNDLLNLNNRKWNHPSDKTIDFNYSYDDLYSISKEKALILISAIHRVINYQTDIKELIKLIPNLDYATGLPIENNKRLQFFEF